MVWDRKGAAWGGDCKAIVVESDHDNHSTTSPADICAIAALRLWLSGYVKWGVWIRTRGAFHRVPALAFQKISVGFGERAKKIFRNKVLV
jgi:hypothetical protein